MTIFPRKNASVKQIALEKQSIYIKTKNRQSVTQLIFLKRNGNVVKRTFLYIKYDTRVNKKIT